MILLDTNAVLWMLTGHRRAAALADTAARLFLSPVSLLELKFLVECGRLEELGEDALDRVAADPRWRLDNPTCERLFRAALPLDWTRDPFDRLLVAHAKCRRWRLATGDRALRDRLPAEMVLAV
jgi:PIN domain nuclease of toxin-antitoxin system